MSAMHCFYLQVVQTSAKVKCHCPYRTTILTSNSVHNSMAENMFHGQHKSMEQLSTQQCQCHNKLNINRTLNISCQCSSTDVHQRRLGCRHCRITLYTLKHRCKLRVHLDVRYKLIHLSTLVYTPNIHRQPSKRDNFYNNFGKYGAILINQIWGHFNKPFTFYIL